MFEDEATVQGSYEHDVNESSEAARESSPLDLDDLNDITPRSTTEPSPFGLDEAIAREEALLRDEAMERERRVVSPPPARRSSRLAGKRRASVMESKDVKRRKDSKGDEEDMDVYEE
jgi:hypothetical protein